MTNQDLEKKVDTTHRWMVKRTGIRERRISDESTACSDLAVKAAERALEAAGTPPGRVEMIILATNSPDYLNSPPTLAVIQHRLKAVHAAVLDISSACTSFVTALVTADQFIRAGTVSTILVIGAEALSKFVNWEDRKTSVIFSDGAGAVVVKAHKAPGILSSRLFADGGKYDWIINPSGGSRRPVTESILREKANTVRMNGRDVFEFIIQKIPGFITKFLETEGIRIEEVDRFIFHQANLRIINYISRDLGLPAEKVPANIETRGNMSAASIPVLIDEQVRSMEIKPNDLLLVSGFGGGLTWGGSLIRW